MRILITGGFGFVGGRLAQHLQNVGHQVIIGSRNACRPPDWLPDAEVVRTDWYDGRVLAEICEAADVVIHAAGMNAYDCAADPLAALEVNGMATARLVKAAMRANVRRFIYLSTAHVYASPLNGIITEDTCPRNLHPYATSHLAGENAVLSATQREKIEGIVLRLSNAFGAPMHKDVNCWMLLINNLCRQAVETGTMVFRTSGLEQRDFVSMTKVCRVVEALSTSSLGAKAPRVFNLGSGESKTLIEAAELVQEHCKLVLGEAPKILLPKANTGESPPALVYRTDALATQNLQVDVDEIDELKKLINFCRVSFTPSSGRVHITAPNCPLVSVVIPTYNHAHFLGRALQSVLDQTYTNWEALVIDNHSTDNTNEVLRQYSDPRITLLKIHNNGVIAASRNMGIRAAKGEWIAFLDSDDWWAVDKLKICLDRADTEVDLIYHDLEVVTVDLRRKGLIASWQVKSPVTRDLLLRGNAIATSSVVVRKAILERIGGIAEAIELIAAEDLHTWLRIGNITERFVYAGNCLGYYTDHALSVSKNDTSDSFDRATREFLYLLSDSEQARLKSTIYFRKARALFLSENYSLALSYLPRACKNASFQQRIKSLYMILYSVMRQLFSSLFRG